MASNTTIINDGDGSPTVATDHNAIVAENTLKIIYITIGCLGLSGNLLVVSVILRSKTMLRSMTNRYILNQSVVDGSVAFVLIMSSVFEDTGRYLDGLGDDLYCRLWLSKMPLWGLLVSSTYNLVVMTIERFLAVVHPIWHKTSFGNLKFGLSVGFVWFIGPGYNSAYMVPSTAIHSGFCDLYSVWPSEFWQRSVGVFTIVLQFFVPLFVLGYCYIKMAIEMKAKVGAAPSNATASKQSTNSRVRRNIFKTLALVAVCFILCWVCNQTVFLMFNLGYTDVSFTSDFYHFTVVAVFCNCCINPIIYVVKYEPFKRECRAILVSLGAKRFSAQNNTSNGASISTVTP